MLKLPACALVCQTVGDAIPHIARVSTYPSNVESQPLFCHFPRINFSFLSPLKSSEQHVIISVESTPFHTRVQPEQSFGDTLLHLRSVLRGSCGSSSPLVMCTGPEASTIGLSPKRGRFVMAVNPHPAHFCVRVSSQADPCV